jgi:hypothetical protein
LCRHERSPIYQGFALHGVVRSVSAAEGERADEREHETSGNRASPPVVLLELGGECDRRAQQLCVLPVRPLCERLDGCCDLFRVSCPNSPALLA